MKKLLALIVLFCIVDNTYATHAYGGEITWKCFSSGPNAGSVKFYMTLYRDCGTGNATLPGGSVTINSNSPLGSIALTQIGVNTDVSPTCYLTPSPIRCNLVTSGQGALEEARYESGFLILNGTPPASGWEFSYSLCCRPNTITNVVAPGSTNLYLRAIMYPYTVNGQSQNTNTCFDSSPRFLESPRSVLCTGIKHTFGQFAFDEDLDSTFFSWAPVMTTGSTPVNYVSGYAATSPLPNGGSPTFVRGRTGNITLTPSAGGSYATAVKVETFRCGQKIAEVVREIPIVISSTCPSLSQGTGQPNTAPTLTINNIAGYKPLTPMVLANGDTTHFEVTVFAGETVRFNAVAQDAQLLPNGLPQTITFSAVSGQMGSPLGSASSGCLRAPCATATPVAPQIGLSSPLTNEVVFNWQTDCDHVANQSLQCANSVSRYVFALKMQDNFCSVPQSRVKSVIVNVVATQPLPPDLSNSVAVVNPNGGVDMSWGFPLDTGMNFDAYVVYHAAHPLAPFTAIDTLNAYSQLSFSHSNAPVGYNYYFVKTMGGCGSLSIPSDTISSCSNVIIQQPQNVGVFTNSTFASFTCQASDTAALYQWQQEVGSNWINIQNASNYTGVTTDSLVISGLSATMNGLRFRCLVAGCETDTSDAAVLSVRCADTVMVMPQDFTAYTNPGWANFTFRHSDSTALFQWQESSGSSWTNLSTAGPYFGANTDSLVIYGINMSMNNYAYRCIATGCATDTSNVAFLTVLNGIGVDDFEKSSLTIAPNPTSGVFKLSSEVRGNYDLMSLHGHIVESGEVKNEFDLTRHPNGVYLLRIRTSTQTHILKVVKQ